MACLKENINEIENKHVIIFSDPSDLQESPYALRKKSNIFKNKKKNHSTHGSF